MDNNQVSDNLLGYTPAPDAIQEFNLITNNAPAEFGNFEGGIVNATIKSGTNAYHGDIWEFFRNDVLNANSWSNNLVYPGLPKRKCAGICLAAPSAGRLSRISFSFLLTFRISDLMFQARRVRITSLQPLSETGSTIYRRLIGVRVVQSMRIVYRAVHFLIGARRHAPALREQPNPHGHDQPGSERLVCVESVSHPINTNLQTNAVNIGHFCPE